MKNLIKTFAFLLLTTFSIQSFAQDVTFGVRAGINLANVNFDGGGEEESTDSKFGLTIAGLADIALSDALSIQPELHFIQKGYALEFDFFGYTSEFTANINYLELPVHAKYKFGGGGNIGGYVLAGPAVGYALGGKIEICEDGECESEDIEFDDNDGFNRSELSLSLGGGVTFGQLFVDVRYVLGLTSLAEDDADNSKVTNRGVQIGVGYMFGGE